MRIEYLINDTYQVVDNNTNTVLFRGNSGDCYEYVLNTTNLPKQPTITELTARLDKLEQELDWTRDMLDMIKETIDDMNYEQ